MRALAAANTNIALVKYWGKRAGTANLPAVGSISITLSGLATRTTVQFDPALSADRFALNGQEETGEARDKVSRFLDLVRAQAGLSHRARVDSANDFPTASGLASSASGFVALAAAATSAAGLRLSPRELSGLARQGSGSAARSVLGGFVEMTLEGYAQPLLSETAWDLRMVVGVTTEKAKAVSSGRAMEHTTQTSPYFGAWADTHPADLEGARQAIAQRDLERLGLICEASCLKMHAAMLAAQPGLIFWNGATVDLMHRVRALRAQGTQAYFTIDAGPHVKVLCATPEVDAVERAVREVPGVLRTLIASPGPGVSVLEHA